MDDLRTADVDFLTIGQYLQPTRKHHEVVEFVTPEAFKAYETLAYAKGFADGRGLAADALVASRRRGFRAPAPKARRQNGAAAGWLTGGGERESREISYQTPSTP